MVNTVPGMFSRRLAVASSVSVLHLAMSPAPTSTGLAVSGGFLPRKLRAAIVAKITTTTAMTQYGTLATEPLNLHLSVA